METDPYLLALHRLLFRQPLELSKRLAKASAQVVVDSDPALVVDRNLWRLVERDLQWLEQPEHHLVQLTDADYPELLANIHDPPPLLFARGDRSLLALPHKLAVVGARKSSSYGRQQAHDLSATLASQGVAIVSGLALGIDAAAHEGALSASGGQTVAVLGTGCDVIYPKRNWRLADRIVEQGLILSEFPLGTAGYPANFPRRNRIVTGLSRATLVVEAALGSGSLISAELAISQGRDVLAIPGLVTNAGSQGCHQLIRSGAALIENAADVMTELGLDQVTPTGISSKPRLSEEQRVLYECLSEGPQSIDLLAEISGLPLETLSVGLISLEIAGLVTNQSGYYHRRTLS